MLDCGSKTWWIDASWSTSSKITDEVKAGTVFKSNHSHITICLTFYRKNFIRQVKNKNPRFVFHTAPLITLDLQLTWLKK